MKWSSDEEEYNPTMFERQTSEYKLKDWMYTLKKWKVCFPKWQEKDYAISEIEILSLF